MVWSDHGQSVPVINKTKLDDKKIEQKNFNNEIIAQPYKQIFSG